MIDGIIGTIAEDIKVKTTPKKAEFTKALKYVKAIKQCVVKVAKIAINNQFKL